jgi:ethanolamine ammonia-lyase small subunit
MTSDLIEMREGLARLRAATPARIFLPRSGAAIATRANLDFQLAHARARDAVHERMDVDALAAALCERGLDPVRVESAARDRRAYLLRPDLGRRLEAKSRGRLVERSGNYDLAFAIADGLSARAVAAHAIPLLDEAMRSFREWKIAPPVLVEQGRVAIGDEIGEILGARLIAVLVGERPGLSSPDSLGVYLTYEPRVGRSDAERNCLSNIRSEGLSYAQAARKLRYLCTEARRLQLTGVALKDEAPLFLDAVQQARDGGGSAADFAAEGPIHDGDEGDHEPDIGGKHSA